MKLFELGDQYASVGFVRSDGDFELLATFNNSSYIATDQRFYDYVTKHVLEMRIDDESIVALNREDAIDVVMLEDEPMTQQQDNLELQAPKYFAKDISDYSAKVTVNATKEVVCFCSYEPNSTSTPFERATKIANALNGL